MAIAQRRLPWRLPTKWAWAMEKAGPSRKEVAELWRDPARFLMALSLVLRLVLWRDPAWFPMALSLMLRLPLEPQVPSSPAPKRWSSRAFPARHLRPCYRLTRIPRPPGDRERRVQRRSNLLLGPHPAPRAPRPRVFVPRARPSGSCRKERRSAGAGVHCSIGRVRCRSRCDPDQRGGRPDIAPDLRVP